MRIAFLTAEYPTERYFAGGLATYTRNVARALLAAGHEPEVFTLSHTRERIQHESIPIHRIPSHDDTRRPATRGWRLSYSGYAEVFGPAWRIASALRERHREAAFDVVQAANYRACGLIAAAWKVAPVVTRVSSYEPLWREAYRISLSRGQLQIEKAERLQLRWSSAVYAPSQLLADILREKESLTVQVVEPPVAIEPPSGDDSPAGAPAAGTYALFFGQIGLLKGCDRLVAVLPGLLERNPDLRFLFVGASMDAEDGQPFDRHIAERLSRFTGRVTVLPPQQRPQMLSLVQGARFVVLPSRIDNLPNTCLEAMALRRVVVGVKTASFDQLIQDGVSGFLASQTDDAELAACMERAWKLDAAERDRMGLKAQESLERLKPQHTIKQLIGLFEAVAG